MNRDRGQANSVLALDKTMPNGRLVANLMGFIRTLRAAGLPLGPGKTLAAVAAVRAVGLRNRDDFYWALSAALLSRRDQRELFDQAFQVFWRNPRLLERLRLRLTALAHAAPDPPPPDDDPGAAARRLADALRAAEHADGLHSRTKTELETELSWSSRQGLGDKDFEQMSVAELSAAARLLKTLGTNLGLRPLPGRRYRPDQRGARVDLKATLRQSGGLRSELLPLARRRLKPRPPALVLLCDVSGSMDRYSRMLLHFAHALSNDRYRVSTFVFGTQLSNVSRLLRYKDVDQALAKVASSVNDWNGGTRIGHCLRRFNRDWSRRVLGQGAVVVLVSDGLDRGDSRALAVEAERLQKSCRRLLWLNPLLRYDGFEPRAQGVRALLPHVDSFRAAHSINSLAELGALLSETGTGLTAAEEVKQWLCKIPS